MPVGHNEVWCEPLASELRYTRDPKQWPAPKPTAPRPVHYLSVGGKGGHCGTRQTSSGPSTEETVFLARCRGGRQELKAAPRKSVCEQLDTGLRNN